MQGRFKMNKRIVVLLVGVSVLACNFLFPQKVTSTSEPIVAPQSSDSQDVASAGFTMVRLHTNDGDLKTLLADEAQKATALGQTPVVEFDATWCPPCQAI